MLANVTSCIGYSTHPALTPAFASVHTSARDGRDAACCSMRIGRCPASLVRPPPHRARQHDARHESQHCPHAITHPDLGRARPITRFSNSTCNSTAPINRWHARGPPPDCVPLPDAREHPPPPAPNAPNCAPMATSLWTAPLAGTTRTTKQSAPAAPGTGGCGRDRDTPVTIEHTSHEIFCASPAVPFLWNGPAARCLCGGLCGFEIASCCAGWEGPTFRNAGERDWFVHFMW